MIYFVSNQQDLFGLEGIENISVGDSLKMLEDADMLQYDSETTGRDAHLCELLCVQFGDIQGENQIVIDCTTVDITLYKDILEQKYLIGHNLKFDLQFLYNHGIVPRKVYDTMIVEQFIYLGYPVYPKPGGVSYSLASVAKRHLGIDIDKSVRGEIIWRGLDYEVIIYAANDVKWLAKIMDAQLQILRSRHNAIYGAKLECDFTPAIAYLEWCGIKLDEGKWKEKMKHDKANLDKSLKILNDYCMTKPELKKYIRVNNQLDLFEEISLEPYFAIDWQKKEALSVFKDLGFNLSMVSKTTNQETESVLEKHLKSQKNIEPKFLDLYFDYQEFYKKITSFGQGHLNAINPKTGRIHTVYRAIGTKSGRMSSGSSQINTDLAKYKGLPINPTSKQRSEGKVCSYPNMQQLPHDEETRACFVAEKGNLFCSCDWAAMEARIGADVYNEHKLLDEFLYGSGDTHAAYAKAVWPDELKDIPTKEVKAKRPDLRNKVKSIEFAVQFGSDGTAIAPQLGISEEEARNLVIKLLDGMSGLKRFKAEGSRMVRNTGYVEVMPQTGHRIYWWNWEEWKKEQESYTSEFWDEYKLHHKGTGDDIAIQVSQHFKEASGWDRMALNGPTQGGGAVLLKEAATALFNWIVDNGYFGKILLVNFTHDEINSEFPEELKDIYPKLVENFMLEAGAKYYHKLPIPASSEVGLCWIH